jgi:hypothetical protein
MELVVFFLEFHKFLSINGILSYFGLIALHVFKVLNLFVDFFDFLVLDFQFIVILFF